MALSEILHRTNVRSYLHRRKVTYIVEGETQFEIQPLNPSDVLPMETLPKNAKFKNTVQRLQICSDLMRRFYLCQI
jgi:hypothetical protein